MTDRLTRAIAALETAKENARNAKFAVHDAENEFAAASLEAAQQAPHPLAGKTVTRTFVQAGRVSNWSRTRAPDRTITQKGVVTLAGVNGGIYRNHYPKPGEWFVASPSGGTAYRLTDDWTEA